MLPSDTLLSGHALALLALSFRPVKLPPAKPGASTCEPLKAALITGPSNRPLENPQGGIEMFSRKYNLYCAPSQNPL